MAKPKKKPVNKPEASLTFVGMVQNVLLKSMSRGLFLPALGGVICLLVVWKIPAQDVSKLAFGLGKHLADHSLTGYALFLVVLVAWPIHARYQRSLMTHEVRRAANERTRVQEKAAGTKMETSEP